MSSADLAAAKAAARREARAALRALDAADRARRSARLRARLMAEPRWREATRVLLYAPMPEEPGVDGLWGECPAWMEEREIFYPAVRGNGRLELQRVRSLSDLVLGTRNLREPGGGETIEAAGLDTVLVPGLAFTPEGARLGRGGGYYDRLLAALPTTTFTIALCFACQVRPTLPLAPHDFPVQRVLAE